MISMHAYSCTYSYSMLQILLNMWYLWQRYWHCPFLKQFHAKLCRTLQQLKLSYFVDFGPPAATLSSSASRSSIIPVSSNYVVLRHIILGLETWLLLITSTTNRRRFPSGSHPLMWNVRLFLTQGECQSWCTYAQSTILGYNYLLCPC